MDINLSWMQRSLSLSSIILLIVMEFAIELRIMKDIVAERW